MKKVLVIAYYFPPSGGPGVQRVLKHVRYLPKYGWEPTVITVENGDFPARDESLMEEIPEGLTVHRTKIFEPYAAYRRLMKMNEGAAVDVNNIKKDGAKSSLKDKFVEFIRSTFFIPDARSYWRRTAKKEIKEIVRKGGFDAVYSSSPPYTCSLIARDIKRKTKLPWVAGFRDPWTGFISSPKRWFLPAAIDRSMEKSVFSEADAVEAAWLGIISDAIGKYPSLEKDKFHHVPNGFDPNDYPENVDKGDEERFVLTYTGSLYGRRNPKALFEAIEALIEEGKVDPERFLLRFIGRFGTEIHVMFEEVSFKDSIEIIGYVPHHESTAYLFRSDMLLLIVDESKESEEIVPGKVYEYIGTMKPVFAIAPPKSAIADLMHETEAGPVANHPDVEQLAEYFYDYYSQYHAGKTIYFPKKERINQYTRENATKRLAEILDSQLGK